MTRYEQTAAAAAVAGHHSSDTATDLARVSPARSPATGRQQDVDEELRDAFQVFDKDRDGFLNATDLRSVTVALLTHGQSLQRPVTLGWRRGVVVSGVGLINEVNRHRVRLSCN